ncbi:hypothetical protein LCGC14_1727930 [marine sediment metagenome]|uniref:Uncharacterized protein n=1 Tax=marine sediment metagenome TaxID=412755 RepID=A0A0F9HAA7_9ZZZZ|nr:hypothetical protein [Candidatus Scalindua sp.]
MSIKKILFTILETIKLFLEHQPLVPVPGSGIVLSPEDGGPHTQLVEENQIYTITVRDSTYLFSITGETWDEGPIATNIEWVCVDGQTITIRIPEGKTILHYSTFSSSSWAFIRKLA